MTKRTCSIPGCTKVHFGRGWCSAHHAKWRKYGSPTHIVRLTPNGAPHAFIKDVVANGQSEDCIIWPFARDISGYARASVSGRSIVVSAYVCALVHGKRPFPKAEAAHTCGNGKLGCINPRHIEWKTRAANMEDMVEHGTSLRGTRSPHAKLTESDVRQIRSLKNRLLQREIADMFGVDKDTIGAILRRDRWAWLD